MPTIPQPFLLEPIGGGGGPRPPAEPEIPEIPLEPEVPEFDFLGTSEADILASLGFDVSTLSGLLGERFEEGGQFVNLLQPSLQLAQQGLGALPELMSTLTGQATERFGIGLENIGTQRGQLGTREDVLRSGLTLGRQGIQENLFNLAMQSQEAAARSGFARGGAIGRLSRLGRRRAGRQAGELTEKFQTGLESLGLAEKALGTQERGLGASFREALFGSQQQVQRQEAGILGTLSQNINSLLQSLLGAGVSLATPSGGVATTGETQTETFTQGGVKVPDDVLLALKNLDMETPFNEFLIATGLTAGADAQDLFERLQGGEFD